MKALFVRVFVAFVLVLLVASLVAPVALAQSPVAPALPALDELLAMSLRALGGLVFIALFGYAWGYFISALAARLPPEWKVPSWAYDLVILVPTAAVAAGWNAFALFIDAAYPGVLDKTVGSALLWAANAVFALLFARRGGIAQVVDLARLGVQSSHAAPDSVKTVGAARSGVFLVR